MRRILANLMSNAPEHREDREDALLDLLDWLRGGGFAPVFTTEMAGHYADGSPRMLLRFCFCTIMTTAHPDDDRDGWVLVEYTSAGDEIERWALGRGK